jgi:hypothetical protein
MAESLITGMRQVIEGVAGSFLRQLLIQQALLRLREMAIQLGAMP